MGQRTNEMHHMPQLDGLRALAVIAVVVQHAYPYLGKLFPWAHSGVRLFFVLSGFLITGILLRYRIESDKTLGNRWFGLRQFYIRRFLRIFPLYYFVIALAIVLNVEPGREILPTLLTYTLNIYMSIHGHWIDGFFHFWSLAIEEQFYLVWPWFILFAPRKWLLPIISLVILSAPLYRMYAVVNHLNVIATYSMTFACLDSIGLGSLLALISHLNVPSTRSIEYLQRLALPVGVVGVIALRLLRVFRLTWASDIFFDCAIALFFFWLVSRAARGFGGFFGRTLELRSIRYIGKISYGIYVYHAFLPALYLTLKKSIFGSLGWEYSEPGLQDFILIALCVVIVPILSWHLMEQRINGLRRYFDYAPRSLKATKKSCDLGREARP